MTFEIELNWCEIPHRVQLYPTRNGAITRHDNRIAWHLRNSGKHLYLTQNKVAPLAIPPEPPVLQLAPATRFCLTIDAKYEGDAPQFWAIVYGPSGNPSKERINLKSGSALSLTTPPSPSPLPVRIALRLHGQGELSRMRVSLSEVAVGEPMGERVPNLQVGPLGRFRVASAFNSPAGYMTYGQRHHHYYDERSPSWYKKFVGDLSGYHRLLDLGTGPGLLLDAAQAQGIPEVLGIERDDYFLSVARQRGRNILAHDLNEPMPFIPSRSRDVIAAHQVFDYLDETALWGTVREAARILQIGGILKFHMRTDGRSSGDETRAPTPLITRKGFEDAGFDLCELQQMGNGLRGKAVLARDLFAWPVVENDQRGEFGPFAPPTPCLNSAPNAWDDTGDRDFTIVTDESKRAVTLENRLHAVYTAYRAIGDDVSRAIMLAESIDGIAWSRAVMQPVLSADAADPHEAGGLAAGSVIEGSWPNGRFAMFYSCRAQDGTWPGIRLAFSDDLKQWRREPGWALHRDQFRALKQLALADVVRLSDGTWLMHCEGWVERSGWAVFQARSIDGLKWQSSGEGPTVDASIFPWANGHIANPKCFEAQPGRLLLGVNAAPADLRFRLAFLESDNGVEWRKVGPTKLLSPMAGQYRLESLLATADRWNSDGRFYFFAARTKQTHLTSRSLTTARSKYLSYLGGPWTVDEPSLFLVNKERKTLQVVPAATGIKASARRSLPDLSDVRLAGRIAGAASSPADAGLGFSGRHGVSITLDAHGEVRFRDKVLFRPDQQPDTVAFAMTLAGRTAGRPELIVRLWLDGADVLWMQIPVLDCDFNEVAILAGTEGSSFEIDFLDLWTPPENQRTTIGDSHVYGGITADTDPHKRGTDPRAFIRVLEDRRVGHALLVPFGSGAGLDTYDQLCDLARQYPDRFGVLHRVPPILNEDEMIGYQLDQLEILWQEGTLFGLKVHPSHESWPPSPVLRWIEERSLLLMIHIRSAADLEKVRAVAHQTEASLLLSHFGGYPVDRSRYDACIALMEEYTNVFLVSSMVWLTHYLQKACLARPSQVLLGSDYPAADPAAAEAAIAAAELPLDVYSLVAGGNLRFLMDRVVQRRRMMVLGNVGLRFPPVPASRTDLSSAGFEIIATEGLPNNEGQEAKSFWSGYGVRSWYKKRKPWAKHVAAIVRSLRPISVMEFGCNIGRNLVAISELLPSCRLTGLDINQEAIEAGRTATGLDLHLGDENDVAKLGPGAFDLVFTVSVLDHVVDARTIAAILVRSARRYILFIEVCLPAEGKVTRHYDHHFAAVQDSTGASYSWQLTDFLREHPRVERLETRPLYLHDRSLGPYYRMYLAFLKPLNSDPTRPGS